MTSDAVFLTEQPFCNSRLREEVGHRCTDVGDILSLLNKTDKTTVQVTTGGYRGGGHMRQRIKNNI